MKNLFQLIIIVSTFTFAQNSQTNENGQSLNINQSITTNPTLQGQVVYEIK